MLFINCETNLILTWSSTCAITNSPGAGRFAITDTKFYVPVITLSTQDNSKLLQQLKSGFKRVINWNKYSSKPELLAENPNLNHLVEPSFQGAKFKHLKVIHREHHLLTIISFFDQPIKNDKVTSEKLPQVKEMITQLVVC